MPTIPDFQNKHKRSTAYQVARKAKNSRCASYLDLSPIFSHSKKQDVLNETEAVFRMSPDYKKLSDNAEKSLREQSGLRPKINLKINSKMIKIKVSQSTGTHDTKPDDRIELSNNSMQHWVSKFKDNKDATRGVVRGFSARSRKRMIDFMNCQRGGSPKLFVTLTYHDKLLFKRTEHGECINVTNNTDWKKNIEILRKRFERAYPDSKCLWRIEIIDRKSGAFRGLDAPHFHLLIWCNGQLEKMRKKYKLWLKESWIDITKGDLEGKDLTDFKRNGVFVAAIESHRHAMFYVSKYTAKEGNDSHEVGRRWGRIGKFDVSESMQVSFDIDEYIEFRRVIRKWMKSQGKTKQFIRSIANLPLGFGFTMYGIGDDICMQFIYGLLECFPYRDIIAENI